MLRWSLQPPPPPPLSPHQPPHWSTQNSPHDTFKHICVGCIVTDTFFGVLYSVWNETIELDTLFVSLRLYTINGHHLIYKVVVCEDSLTGNCCTLSLELTITHMHLSNLNFCFGYGIHYLIWLNQVHAEVEEKQALAFTAKHRKQSIRVFQIGTFSVKPTPCSSLKSI